MTHNWWMHKMEHRRLAISLSGVHTWRKSFPGPSFCSLHWCLNNKSALDCDAPPTRTGQVHLPLVRIIFVHPLPIQFQAINCCMVQFWNEISLRIFILEFHNSSFCVLKLNLKDDIYKWWKHLPIKYSGFDVSLLWMMLRYLSNFMTCNYLQHVACSPPLIGFFLVTYFWICNSFSHVILIDSSFQTCSCSLTLICLSWMSSFSYFWICF